MADSLKNRLRSSSRLSNSDPQLSSKTKKHKPVSKSSRSKQKQSSPAKQGYIPTHSEKVNPALLICPCGAESNENSWWIACSKCHQWWHNQCAGLPNQEVESDTYQCIFCTIKHIKSPQVLREINTLTKQSPVETSDNQEGTSFHGQKDTTNSNIVILDGINNLANFHKSSQIKAEIKRTNPKLNVKQAYPLARGGIALHCSSDKDYKHALSPWSETAFGSKIVPHKPACHLGTSSVIVRSVNTTLTDSNIETNLSTAYNSPDIKVRRFLHRHTKKPLPLIEVTADSNIAATLIRDGVQIFGKEHKTEPKRKYRVIRCYSCQAYGHVAKDCQNGRCCHNCGSDHPSAPGCTLPTFCVNCQDTSHSADSKECPVYTAVLARLYQRSLLQ